MNTNELRICSSCPNDLVCHDLGECRRPTPETDEQIGCGYEVGGKVRLVQLVQPDFARRLERERDEARAELAAMREAMREAEASLAGMVQWFANMHRPGLTKELLRRIDACDAAFVKLEPFIK